jgi:hypothetical protein
VFVVSRPGRNRRIANASGEVISSGLSRVQTGPTEPSVENTEIVITCKDDAPSKADFLANPPLKITFRYGRYHETVCTRLENKAQWVTYLLVLPDKSIYNVLFIFKEPCDKQRHLTERRLLPDPWQIIPIDVTRSGPLGIRMKCDFTLLLFELIGFDIYASFTDV